MNREIKLRQATADDALYIAKSMNMASGGIINFLFSDSLDSSLINKLLSFEIYRKNSPLFYENTIIAELYGNPIGMVTGYGGNQHKPTDPNSIVTSDKIKCLQPFYDIDLSDTFYVDSVYVDKKFRRQFKRQGIAHDLVNAKLQDGKKQNFRLASTFCWKSNIAALMLAHECSFEDVLEIFANNKYYDFKKEPRILLQRAL